MSLLQIAEIFGHDIQNLSQEATEDRRRKWCPFRKSVCTKSNKTNPLGICSFSDGNKATVVCPVRFLEQGKIFSEVGRLAFGSGIEIAVAPEIRLLRSGNSARRKIGKVDFLIAKLDANKRPVDFAALEVQAVYFSGAGIRPAFDFFLQHGHLQGQDSSRRADFRSSAQKRLMPQLSLKVPVFRRWGKKFFVVVDDQFFGALPKIKTVDSLANSEITWLVYPLAKQGHGYSMQPPALFYTVWDDVLTALREGEQPEPGEILDEISSKLETLPRFTT